MAHKVRIDPDAFPSSGNNLAIALGKVHEQGKHPGTSPVAIAERALRISAGFAFTEEDCTKIEVRGEGSKVLVNFCGIKDLPGYARSLGDTFAGLYGLALNTPISDPVEAFREHIAFVAGGGEENRCEVAVEITNS